MTVPENEQGNKIEQLHKPTYTIFATLAWLPNINSMFSHWYQFHCKALFASSWMYHFNPPKPTHVHWGKSDNTCKQNLSVVGATLLSYVFGKVVDGWNCSYFMFSHITETVRQFLHSCLYWDTVQLSKITISIYFFLILYFYLSTIFLVRQTTFVFIEKMEIHEFL